MKNQIRITRREGLLGEYGLFLQPTNVLHNIDGPAAIDRFGKSTYAINGIKIQKLGIDWVIQNKFEWPFPDDLLELIEILWGI